MRRLVLILLCSTPLHAQPPGIDSMWTFPTDEGGYLTDMVQLPDGGFLFGGHTGSYIMGNWFLCRTDVSGDTLWTRPAPRDHGFEPEIAGLLPDGFLVFGSVHVPVDSNSAHSYLGFWKLDFNGDTLPWNLPIEENFTFGLIGCAVDATGNVLLCSREDEFIDTLWNTCLRVVKTNSNGEPIWDRCYGSIDFWEETAILTLPSGEIVVSCMSYPIDGYELWILWLNSEGDSVRSFQHPYPTEWYASGRRLRLGPDGSTNFTTIEYEIGGDDPIVLRWIRFNEFGQVLTDVSLLNLPDFLAATAPVDDGILLVGTSPYNGSVDRDILVARGALTGDWQFVAQIPMPLYQSGNDVFTLSDSSFAILGGHMTEEFIADPTVFFISDEGPTGYLYSSPTRLDFGVVPLEETGSITVQLHLTGDTTAIITDFSIAENFATGLHVPDTIFSDVPFEFLIGFRPLERRIYLDTLSLFSTALNTELIIPLRGQAPFPILAPQSELLDFHWVHLGDSVQRQFTLFNTGTDTLHIQEFNEHPPFHFDTLGPLTILEGDSLTLAVTFHPEELGLFDHWLHFESNDPEELDSVRLLGRCVSPNDADDVPEIPREFILYPAYPNPFNSRTSLRFDLPHAFHVKLTLYNLPGQEAALLADAHMNAGTHSISVETASLASGLYFAHLVAGENIATQKLVLLK